MTPRPRRSVTIAVFLIAPILIMAGSGALGWLAWQRGAAAASRAAHTEAVQAARDTAIAILGYEYATAESTLNVARARLTGQFLDSYTALVRDVVIPGARQKKITALVSVPAASVISAGPTRAEVLLYVNQSISVGDGTPTDTTSAVTVTLDHRGGQWLVSGFTPI